MWTPAFHSSPVGRPKAIPDRLGRWRDPQFLHERTPQQKQDDILHASWCFRNLVTDPSTKSLS